MKPEDYYGQVEARSEDWSSRALEPGFAPMKDVIDAARTFLSPGGRILDIGCQGGHQLALLSGPDRVLIGVDLSDYGHMWKQFPEIEFLVRDLDAEPLPFPGGYFKTVIATNVLEHVFDVVGLVSEIARVLEIGGRALIAVPNVSSQKHIRSLIRGRVPRTGAVEYPFDLSQGWDGQHLHYFTHKELSWLLKEFNLEVEKVLHVGRLQWLKRLFPRYLSNSVDLVCIKVGP